MPDRVQMLIEIALQEDIGAGDITTDALFQGEGVEKSAALIAKENLVVAGLEVARRVFDTVDHHLKWEALVEDGAFVKAGTSLAKVSGRMKSLLKAERTALNFLQHLSGVATLTRQFVEKVKHTSAKILDTRKTTPGFRTLEKYAVKMGGGVNHRFGLYDRYLIKDNHLVGVSITEALECVKSHNVGRDVLVELEVDSLEQVPEALQGSPDILLLDNFSTKDLKKAVTLIAGCAKTEASGGITLDNVIDYANTGVDLISIGTLTHSARSVDISLDMF